MCNEIYVPKDAFIVRDESTRFEDARPSNAMQERYAKYYRTLMEQGYKPEVAKEMANERLKLCFNIFMAKNYKEWARS